MTTGAAALLKLAQGGQGPAAAPSVGASVPPLTSPTSPTAKPFTQAGLPQTASSTPSASKPPSTQPARAQPVVKPQYGYEPTWGRSETGAYDNWWNTGGNPSVGRYQPGSVAYGPDQGPTATAPKPGSGMTMSQQILSALLPLGIDWIRKHFGKTSSSQLLKSAQGPGGLPWLPSSSASTPVITGTSQQQPQPQLQPQPQELKRPSLGSASSAEIRTRTGAPTLAGEKAFGGQGIFQQKPKYPKADIANLSPASEALVERRFFQPSQSTPVPYHGGAYAPSDARLQLPLPKEKEEYALTAPAMTASDRARFSAQAEERYGADNFRNAVPQQQEQALRFFQHREYQANHPGRQHLQKVWQNDDMDLASKVDYMLRPRKFAEEAGWMNAESHPVEPWLIQDPKTGAIDINKQNSLIQAQMPNPFVEAGEDAWGHVSNTALPAAYLAATEGLGAGADVSTWGARHLQHAPSLFDRTKPYSGLLTKHVTGPASRALLTPAGRFGRFLPKGSHGLLRATAREGLPGTVSRALVRLGVPRAQASPYIRPGSTGGAAGTKIFGRTVPKYVPKPVGPLAHPVRAQAAAAARNVGLRGGTGAANFGLWATPLNAIAELADAAGGLPTWLGGTGIGSFGWEGGKDYHADPETGYYIKDPQQAEARMREVASKNPGFAKLPADEQAAEIDQMMRVNRMPGFTGQTTANDESATLTLGKQIGGMLPEWMSGFNVDKMSPEERAKFYQAVKDPTGGVLSSAEAGLAGFMKPIRSTALAGAATGSEMLNELGDIPTVAAPYAAAATGGDVNKAMLQSDPGSTLGRVVTEPAKRLAVDKAYLKVVEKQVGDLQQMLETGTRSVHQPTLNPQTGAYEQQLVQQPLTKSDRVNIERNLAKATQRRDKLKVRSAGGIANAPHYMSYMLPWNWNSPED